MVGANTFSMERWFLLAISTICMARMVMKLNSFARKLKDLYFLFYSSKKLYWFRRYRNFNIAEDFFLYPYVFKDREITWKSIWFAAFAWRVSLGRLLRGQGLSKLNEIWNVYSWIAFGGASRSVFSDFSFNFELFTKDRPLYGILKVKFWVWACILFWKEGDGQKPTASKNSEFIRLHFPVFRSGLLQMPAKK